MRRSPRRKKAPGAGSAPFQAQGGKKGLRSWSERSSKRLKKCAFFFNSSCSEKSRVSALIWAQCPPSIHQIAFCSLVIIDLGPKKIIHLYCWLLLLLLQLPIFSRRCLLLQLGKLWSTTIYTSVIIFASEVSIQTSLVLFLLEFKTYIYWTQKN